MSELTVKALREAMQKWNKVEDISGHQRYFLIFPDGSCDILSRIDSKNDRRQYFDNVELMYEHIQNKIQPDMKLSFSIPSSALRKAKAGDLTEVNKYIGEAVKAAVVDWEKSC